MDRTALLGEFARACKAAARAVSLYPAAHPTIRTTLARVTAAAGLRWRDLNRFGNDYARTLSEWQGRFQSAWSEVSHLGFDSRFKRLWEYYLAFCEAGFRAGHTDVIQVGLARD